MQYRSEDIFPEAFNKSHISIIGLFHPLVVTEEKYLVMEGSRQNCEAGTVVVVQYSLAERRGWSDLIVEIPRSLNMK